MGNIINMQEWVAQQQKDKGIFDFGKPYEDLTDLEVKFIVNHLKDMINSLFEVVDQLKEIHEGNVEIHVEHQETISQLVQNSNALNEYNKEAQVSFKHILQHIKSTNARLDSHTEQINRLTKR